MRHILTPWPNTFRINAGTVFISAVLSVTVFTAALLYRPLPLWAAPTKNKDISNKRIITLQEAVQRGLTLNRNLLNVSLMVESSSLNLAASDADFDLQVRPYSSISYYSKDNPASWNIGGRLSKRFFNGVVVGLDPGYQYFDDHFNDRVDVSLDLPLLRGLGKQTARDHFLSAQNQLKANRYSQKTIKVQIVLAIISTFYDILREQHLIVLYKEQLTIMNHHLHLVRLQKQADIASPMDLYRAEIRRGDIEDNINSSLERLKDLANILKNMISLPLSLNLTVTASLEEKPLDTDLELAIQAALANRAELQRADLELQEAYRKQSIAENNLLPDLHLVTEYSYLKEGSNDLSDQQSERQNIWALRLEGSTDITNNNARAAVEQSRLAIQRKRIGYDNTVQSISAEIRSIINRLEKIRQRIRLRDEQITQAKGKLGLARIKFKYGEAGNFDLIEAQNQLQRAKSDHLSERTRYITEGYRFHGAQGTLLSQFE